MDLTSRIAQKYIAAKRPEYGPITFYEDWLKNNPEFAAMKTVAPALMRRLVQGLNLRAMPAAMRFFQIADQVLHMSMGAPIEDVSQEFRGAARYLSQAVIRAIGDEKGAEIANALVDCATDNLANLRRIAAGAKGQMFTNFGVTVAEAVEKLARAVNVAATYQVKAVEGTRWPTIRLLTKKEQELQVLQDNNPKLYAEVKENLEKAQGLQVTQAIKNLAPIAQKGLVPTTVDYGGVPFPASEDYVTKQKTVYTPEGPLSEQDFKRSQFLKARKNAMLSSEFSTMYVMKDGKPEVVRRPDQLKVAGLTKLSDEDLNNPEVIPLGSDGNPQKAEFRAMTDDKAAAGKRGTRIYPTRRDVNGKLVIVDGRFKGFYLDDMVNERGRLVEGAAYDMDLEGVPVAFETLEADDTLRLSAVNKEPYVTLDSEGKFLIKIPSFPTGRAKDPFKMARDKMKSLSSLPEVVKRKKGPDGKMEKTVTPGRTRGTSIWEVLRVSDEERPSSLFTFDVQDFGTVRDAVGGMCMSSEAAKKLRDYYNQQARVEESTRQEKTKSYSLDRIGGFKTSMKVDPATGEPFDPPVLTKDLMSKQKEALSWIEAKGYKGLAALDTGVGKTLLTIATMQKMVRDGAAEEGSRFLYVCPSHLRGNFPMELQAWMTEEASKGLLSRVDVMSYEDFQFAVNGGKRPVKQKVPGTEKTEKVLDDTGNPMRGPDGKLVYRRIPGTEKEVAVKDAKGKRVYETVPPQSDLAKKYAAVFFDEAQILVKNENDKFSVAAQRLDHPRKVMLTASPMEDDPDQLYIGVAITNNQRLSRKAIPAEERQRGKLTQGQKELMAFRRRFVERVAGRPMGIKTDDANDPTKRQDFNAWVKNGMYFADKRTIGAPGTSEKEQEMKLPELLKQQPVSLTMQPEVEIEYRKAAQGIAKLLKMMVTVFRDDRGKELSTANKELVSRFAAEFNKYRKQLDMLSNYPDEVVDPATGEKKFPGMVSSKVVGATWLVNEKIASGKRTLLFTDDDKLATKTAVEMSRNTPGHGIAVALKGKVIVYLNGEVYDKGGAGKQVFTPREYTNLAGEVVKKEDWASHVLREIIGGDPTVKALVLTKPYALGQNLQMFSTVVHLDRDNFSNEMMKQRQARAWRTGQKEPVEEYTMDAVYDDATGKDDPTLDEARKYVQEVQEKIFNEIVHKSREAVLGEEWKGMAETQASLMAVNRKLLELAIAPYPKAVGEQVYSQAVAQNS